MLVLEALGGARPPEGRAPARTRPEAADEDASVGTNIIAGLTRPSESGSSDRSGGSWVSSGSCRSPIPNVIRSAARTRLPAAIATATAATTRAQPYPAASAPAPHRRTRGRTAAAPRAQRPGAERQRADRCPPPEPRSCSSSTAVER